MQVSFFYLQNGNCHKFILGLTEFESYPTSKNRDGRNERGNICDQILYSPAKIHNGNFFRD